MKPLGDAFIRLITMIITETRSTFRRPIASKLMRKAGSSRETKPDVDLSHRRGLPTQKTHQRCCWRPRRTWDQVKPSALNSSALGVG
jgi:hypothetical protein